MIRSFLVLLILACFCRDVKAQEDLHIEVSFFDIVPGVGPQTKTVRFSYDRVGDEDETQIILNHVNVRYAVAASMEIEIDFRYLNNGTLLNFVKSVRGYDCGKETMDYDNGKLIARTFEPYDVEDCVGTAREPAVSKNKEISTHTIFSADHPS